MTVAEPTETTIAGSSAASRMETPDRRWSWWLFIGSVLVGLVGFIAVWELRSIGAPSIIVGTRREPWVSSPD